MNDVAAPPLPASMNTTDKDADKTEKLEQASPSAQERFYTCLPKDVRVAYKKLTKEGGFNDENLADFAQSMRKITVDLRHEEQAGNVNALINAVRSFGERNEKMSFFAHLKKANPVLARYHDRKYPHKTRPDMI